MSTGSIQHSLKDGHARIKFYHPKGNSFPSEQLMKLVDTLNFIDQQEEVKLIVLESQGEGAFCAGASFDELLALEDEKQALDFFSGFAHVLNAMRACRKPIICRVQGKAVGGGLGIVAAADYAFATEQADVKLSELSIGIGPFVIAPAIIRRSGIAAFSELSLDAHQWKTAYWAQKQGLFQKVYDSTRDMDQDIQLLVDKLSNYSAQALMEMKKVFWAGTDDWPTLMLERAAISGRLVLADEAREALKKFKKS